MFISPTELLSILEQYRYWIIFPIAIFEGPIIIIISGFLVSLGVLNGVVAYSVLVFADIIGDSIYYAIGRYWGRSKWIKKIGKYIGYDERSEAYIQEHFKKHKIKTFMIGKISHGLGGTIQVASGIAKVSYYEFLWLSLLGTVPKALLLIVIGYYLGSYYDRINGYLQNMAFFSVSLLVFVLLFFISKNMKNSFLKPKV